MKEPNFNNDDKIIKSENEFITHFENDKLFEEFIWAINKIGKPINGVITMNGKEIKIHPMILQYSIFLENGRHIENEIKIDLLKIIENNIKEYILLFSKITGNTKFNFIIDEIENNENEIKRKEEEQMLKEREIKEKYKKIEDIFNDENIMSEAKKLRRIYGKGVYISHLKDKAKELGLGNIEINEDDIE
jgi:hypothetical protein